ncbi:sugar ABC transporter ATP-binding protein [Nonomuraea soli]|uniref:Ribose transport system ATP-binding protein n=1 Tax=Nonomuraea soli TaxID=1032476 RepID=A0A7W0HNZ3_9ACTN|nr:sugar ABC transporter ATP-binding protein [Nonomuraea soli]MBA2890318.1 ribose transport system ATP-binding protein [Nonomuraea soli]
MTSTAPVPTLHTFAVRATGVDRAFGGVRALRDASFSARPGEIHALAGENGAGKSTLIKVLCGLVAPDRGRVEVNGRVATAFQELSLLPDLTVAENLLLADPPRGRLGLVRRGRLAPEARRILERFGVDHIDSRAVCADLPVSHRQVVELVRVLATEPRVVFLDEPTAALPDRQVEWLAGHMRRLRDEGCCVIFTSHRWREIERLADRVTVMRNGTHVATREKLAEAEAVTLMSGRTLGAMYPEIPPPATAGPALSFSDPGGISFDLRPGEILGVGGLAGQGQRELFLTLFGAGRPARVTVDGRPIRIRRPKDAIRAGLGIAYVPEDRKAEGLFLPLSVRDNITLATLGRRSAAGFVRRGAERAEVAGIVSRLGIAGGGAAAGTLSGGNQQKVVMARWLLADARVLLLFDVTRGVDAATKHDLYRLVAELARAGKAILYYSSETEEIAHLCHRVLVLREGRVAAELPGPVRDAERIVAAAIADGEAHA